MALTDAEKRRARATDPRAAALIDRVGGLPAEMLERMHGAIRYLKAVPGAPPAPVAPARRGPAPRAPTRRALVLPGQRPCRAWTRRAGARPAARAWGTPGPVPSRAAPNSPLAAMAGDPQLPWWDPGADTSVSPETDHIIVDGVRIARGSRVRMRPGSRRTDAQDLFLVGREALVEAVLHDVDGHLHLAVTPGR